MPWKINSGSILTDYTWKKLEEKIEDGVIKEAVIPFVSYKNIENFLIEKRKESDSIFYFYPQPLEAFDNDLKNKYLEIVREFFPKHKKIFPESKRIGITSQEFESKKGKLELEKVFILPSLNMGAVFSTLAIGYGIDCREILKKVGINYLETVIKEINEKKIKFLIFTCHGSEEHLKQLNEISSFIENKYLIEVKPIFLHGLVKEIFKNLENDIHAGCLETSLLLYLNSELVDLNSIKDSKGKIIDENIEINKDLLKHMPLEEFIKNLNKNWKYGIRGYPSKANKELGKKYANLILKEVLKSISKPLDKGYKIGILPIDPQEEHGWHLPLGADMYESELLAKMILEK